MNLGHVTPLVHTEDITAEDRQYSWQAMVIPLVMVNVSGPGRLLNRISHVRCQGL